jgi:hypothetical protein
MGRNYRRRLLDKSERHGRSLGQGLRQGGPETYHPDRPGEHHVLFLDMGHVDESSHGNCCSGHHGEWEWKR